jgi:hypothetical protein
MIGDLVEVFDSMLVGELSTDSLGGAMNATSGSWRGPINCWYL